MTRDLRGKRRPATNRKKERGQNEEGDLRKVGSKKVVAHFTIFYYKKGKISLFSNMIQRSPLRREGGRGIWEEGRM